MKGKRLPSCFKTAAVSVIYNLAAAVGKFVMSAVSGSFFLAVNAFYNIGVGAAKVVTIKTEVACKSSKEAGKVKMKKYNDAFRLIGSIVCFASAMYAGYSIRLFLGHDKASFDKITGIAIAVLTFTELFLSIYGWLKSRKARAPMVEALKMINFASSLISIVLTQTALLSLETARDHRLYNGVAGVTFGSLAAMVGVVMILLGSFRQSGYVQAWLKRKITAQVKKIAPDIEILDYVEVESRVPSLFFAVSGDGQDETIAQVKKEIYKKYRVELIAADRRVDVALAADQATEPRAKR